MTGGINFLDRVLRAALKKRDISKQAEDDRGVSDRQGLCIMARSSQAVSCTKARVKHRAISCCKLNLLRGTLRRRSLKQQHGTGAPVSPFAPKWIEFDFWEQTFDSWDRTSDTFRDWESDKRREAAWTSIRGRFRCWYNHVMRLFCLFFFS